MSWVKTNAALQDESRFVHTGRFSVSESKPGSTRHVISSKAALKSHQPQGRPDISRLLYGVTSGLESKDVLHQIPRRRVNYFQNKGTS